MSEQEVQEAPALSPLLSPNDYRAVRGMVDFGYYWKPDAQCRHQKQNYRVSWHPATGEVFAIAKEVVRGNDDYDVQIFGIIRQKSHTYEALAGWAEFMQMGARDVSWARDAVANYLQTNLVQGGAR